MATVNRITPQTSRSSKNIKSNIPIQPVISDIRSDHRIF